MEIYTIIRQLARDKNNAFLIPWVETMKRTNPLGHKRNKAGAAEEGGGEPERSEGPKER